MMSSFLRRLRAEPFPQRLALQNRPVIVAMLCCWTLQGMACRAELPASVQGEIDTTIKQFMEAHRVPGLSAALVVDHKIAYEQGYGLADIENNVPASPLTVYRLASISKMITAVGILQLVESGELHLDTPLRDFLPDFPEHATQVTSELLLKHQSGIRHYQGDEITSTHAYANVSDAFAVFRDDPLLFTPGEKFSYTTYGFNLLGAVIERASGQNFVEFIGEQICRPAGMNTLRPDRPSQIIPHRAAGYRLRGTVLLNDVAVDVTNKIPGGGWCSTSGDLARFAIALNQEKLINRKSLERMWTPQKTSSGEQTDSGLGCFIGEIDGDRVISHSGGQPKVATHLIFSPKRKTAVALMCNLRGGSVKGLGAELMRKLANLGEDRPGIPTPSTPTEGVPEE